MVEVSDISCHNIYPDPILITIYLWFEWNLEESFDIMSANDH